MTEALEHGMDIVADRQVTGTLLSSAMEQGSWWETKTVSSTRREEIPPILRCPKVCYHVQKSSPLVRISL
jgi:hypothetical protein